MIEAQIHYESCGRVDSTPVNVTGKWCVKYKRVFIEIVTGYTWLRKPITEFIDEDNLIEVYYYGET